MIRSLFVTLAFLGSASAFAYSTSVKSTAGPGTPIDKEIYEKLSTTGFPCKKIEKELDGASTCNFKIAGSLVCTRNAGPVSPEQKVDYHCRNRAIEDTSCVRDMFTAFPKTKDVVDVREVIVGDERVAITRSKDGYRLEYTNKTKASAGFAVPAKGSEKVCDPLLVCDQLTALYAADTEIAATQIKASPYCLAYYKDSVRVDPAMKRDSLQKNLKQSPPGSAPKKSGPVSEEAV